MRHIQPPFLRQQGKEKKEKPYFMEANDIQRVMETWLTNNLQPLGTQRKGHGVLSIYLFQSVDRSKATDVGVERAVAVVKWWLVLPGDFGLRRRLAKET